MNVCLTISCYWVLYLLNWPLSRIPLPWQQGQLSHLEVVNVISDALQL
jgi:hypothetical protein